MRPFIKTVIFLHVDERWDNLRIHLLYLFGSRGTTFMFGVIISIVCPLMFGLQNVILGMVLTNGPINKSTFYHVIRSLQYQLVVLYDTSLFEIKTAEKQIKMSWRRVRGVIIGYAVYMLPIVALGLVFQFGEPNVTICRPLKATFLVNNEANLCGYSSLSEIYSQRRTFVSDKDPFMDNGGLLWDQHEGYRFQEYFPLNNTADLIDQFNYAGYHDICIYPRMNELRYVLKANNIDVMTKGLRYVYPGYENQNSSGMEHYLY